MICILYKKSVIYTIEYNTLLRILFVLDLSVPENPKVLGELKIPGYSKYLHPLGENYLIGFGEDSIEKKITNYDGTEDVTAAAHDEIGAMMQIGAAVASIIYDSFDLDTLNLSVTGRITEPTVKQLK